jgi:hypothetical protein
MDCPKLGSDRILAGEAKLGVVEDDGRFGIHQGRAAFHSNSLRGGAEGQLEVDCKYILNMKDHIWLGHLLEAGLFDFETIGAGGRFSR